MHDLPLSIPESFANIMPIFFSPVAVCDVPCILSVVIQPNMLLYCNGMEFCQTKPTVPWAYYSLKHFWTFAPGDFLYNIIHPISDIIHCIFCIHWYLLQQKYGMNSIQAIKQICYHVSRYFLAKLRLILPICVTIILLDFRTDASGPFY